MDTEGRAIVLRECVALSPAVHQPILCFGKHLQAGWGVQNHSLVHDSGGVQIPISLQNRSMAVRGWVRVLSSSSTDAAGGVQPMMTRTVTATLVPDLADGRIGWNLDDEGCGVGRHYADCFQDPTVFKPDLAGKKYRTTLA